VGEDGGEGPQDEGPPVVEFLFLFIDVDLAYMDLI
jgi:hypothetical protein